MKVDKTKILVHMARQELDNKTLAELLGVSAPAVGHMLKAKTLQPKTAGKLAKALGVDVTEILAD